MNNKELIAHARYDEDKDSWIVHSLEDHLKGTAELAEKFVHIFGIEKKQISLVFYMMKKKLTNGNFK